MLPPFVSATTLVHVDTRDLTLQSSDIVIGRVETVRSYWNPARTRIFTDVTVQVSRDLKGTCGEQLVLTELGGEVDGVRVTVPGCPAFHPGEEALFFTWRNAKGRAQLNGLAQGKFEIRRDAATGEAWVQRHTPGFAVRDARRLEQMSAGEPAPRIALDELVGEIQRVLRNEGSR